MKQRPLIINQRRTLSVNARSKFTGIKVLPPKATPHGLPLLNLNLLPIKPIDLEESPLKLQMNPGEEWRRDTRPKAKDFDGVFYHVDKKRTVIISWAHFPDNKRWLHVSLSHKDRIPTYEELCEVKARFVGEDKKAIMVFPTAENHVNIHPNCLHLWHCLDEDPLPEFSDVVGGVRTI
jgi:hypothetical protein